MTTDNRLTIIHQSPAYWRVVTNNPPLNLFDPKMFAEFNVLMDDMEEDKQLKVVVFESGDDDFFMNHHDVENRLNVPDQPGAMPFFGNWPKFVTRLAQSSVISIAKVRGRARAQGFEFALACDLRFASKERAKFALIEVGGSSIPGGGGVEWLSALVGRSRTLEIVCSADDFDADIGERYGFVNQSIRMPTLMPSSTRLQSGWLGSRNVRWRPAKKWSTGGQVCRRKATSGPQTISSRVWIYGPSPRRRSQRCSRPAWARWVISS